MGACVGDEPATGLGDGKDFADTDQPHVKVIVYDMVETHLRHNVLTAWATDKAQQPAPANSASAGTG